MPITDTSVFRTRSAALVLATVLANEIFHNIVVYLVTIIYCICNTASFYIFYASSVALNTVLLIEETIKLKQNINQNILNKYI